MPIATRKQKAVEPPQCVEIKTSLSDLRRHALSFSECEPVVIAADMHVALVAMAYLADIRTYYKSVYDSASLSVVQEHLRCRVEEALAQGWHSPWESYYRSTMDTGSCHALFERANVCTTLLPFAPELYRDLKGDPDAYLRELRETCWLIGSARIQGHAQAIYNVMLTSCIEPDAIPEDGEVTAQRSHFMLHRLWKAVQRLATHYSDRRVGMAPEPLARVVRCVESRVCRTMSRLAQGNPLHLHLGDIKSLMTAMEDPIECKIARRWLDWSYPLLNTLDKAFDTALVTSPSGSWTLTEVEQVLFREVDAAIERAKMIEREMYPHVLSGAIKPLPWEADVRRSHRELIDLEAKLGGASPAVPPRGMSDSAEFPFTDLRSLCLHWRGQRVHLGNTVLFRLASCLSSRQGDYLSVEHLENAVWQGQSLSPGTLKTTVARLREKIKDAGVADITIDGSQRSKYRMVVEPIATDVTKV